MKALITGITGQDGSYLADLLVSKGYKVYGLVRHSSTPNYWRIQHLLNKISLVEGDLTDPASMAHIIKDVRPDEVYNLAAQSFVPSSWSQPVFTTMVNSIGVLNLLEGIKDCNKDIKFYQASTSEMFGLVQEIPQRESTPFYPRSPYGVSKLYSHWLTVNYKESYDMFSCSGILFNHESILKDAPLIIKDNQGNIDVLPIEDLFKSEKHRYENPPLLDKFIGLSVWNGKEFSKIIGGSCYKDITKPTVLVQTRGSTYESTEDHVVFDSEDKEVKTKDVRIGDKVFICDYPKTPDHMNNSEDLAFFLGFVVGDGHISKNGDIRLTGCDLEEITNVANIFKNMYGFDYRVSSVENGRYDNCKNKIFSIDFLGSSKIGIWLRSEIYTKSKEKRVPKFILNANNSVKSKFFSGYYAADGRKAGNEQYEFKGFTSKSQTLTLGLNILFNSISNQTIKTSCEVVNGRKYYYTKFTTPNATSKGKHLIKDKNEVVKIIKMTNDDGWFFDIQTESQTFCTGSNLFKIHNSPRRGVEFVSKKITTGAVKIKLGLENNLKLGNLEAKRDWGFAGDYVEAMWLMLQQDKPDTFVIGSGETHTIREFCDITFKMLDLDYERYVEIDPQFFRPAEVQLLLSDPTKARTELGWNPKYNFVQLVEAMVAYDYNSLSRRL